MATQNNKQQQFHEALLYIVETANINGGTVTLDEIHKTFDGIIDDASDYEHIYNYLLENKISIKDYIIHNKCEIPEENSAEPEGHEQKIVEMYKKEVATTTVTDSKETEQLLTILLSHDTDKDSPSYKDAFNHLIEGHLQFVLSIVNTYEHKGVPSGDLIQEGNLALIEGISDYIDNHTGTTPDANDFSLFIKHILSQRMSDAISAEHTASRIGNHIADNANRLDKASVTLSQDLGRTPTVDELAKFLSISTDEVERVMKMSLDALNADDADLSDNEHK